MKIGVLGTGMVGHEIATRLVSQGHQIMMGSRSADNHQAQQWSETNLLLSSHGTFNEAVMHSDDIVFNCTKGEYVLDVLGLVGTNALANKILVDLSNPLDFSNGMPPTLSVVNTDSLGEQIQRKYPDTKVIKTLNTLSNEIMLNPTKLNGDHNIFMSGNDDAAKLEVQSLLIEFGWAKDQIIDLGGISSARATEMLLPIWLSIYAKYGHSNFNFSIVKND